MRRLLLNALRCAALLALPLGASAQAAANDLLLVPSPALRCLTPELALRGKPVYPPLDLQERTGGRVQIELVFTTPDKRPEVLVLESTGSPAFVESVKNHVRQLRVPCLEDADIPTRLRQTFVFKPEEQQITWSTLTDPTEPDRQRKLACVVRDKPGEKPNYPYSAQRAGQSGRVLVVARFTAADQPPEVRTFDSTYNHWLVDFAKEWVSGYRMPCFAGGPVEVTYTLVFRFEGDPNFGFNNLTLRQFLGGMKGLEKQNVAFDFNAMQCPFMVELNYRQPHLPNVAGAVGAVGPAAVAERLPFLEWLAQVELKLAGRQAAAVVGARASFEVPCGHLKLAPSSGKP